MSGHTPGPWLPAVLTHHERGDLLTPHEVAIYVLNGINATVERSLTTEFVAVNVGDMHVCLVGNGPDRVANARLIAAAPELLEALRDMVSDHADLSDSTIEFARAAIAKATQP